jgi:hypothetical protein
MCVFLPIKQIRTNHSISKIEWRTKENDDAAVGWLGELIIRPSQRRGNQEWTAT